ncbi:dTMP kinase [Kitasatospora sp. NBC_00240]|uniref:dTMP kinase n=1 Tax=Kitasatospora sp. NBC_00240 TaxID=2903567 RepID=UPI00225A2387|nr:dTMP kinase [Kitasatospora sp. NBC_00240]MCX5208660.1 dTMP kinase [Kitasatospora sp. NBC_00240]
MLHASPAALTRLQRVLLVALAILPLLLVTAATVPALTVLPFSRQGAERALLLMTSIREHTRTLLAGSR